MVASCPLMFPCLQADLRPVFVTSRFYLQCLDFLTLNNYVMKSASVLFEGHPCIHAVGFRCPVFQECVSPATLSLGLRVKKANVRLVCVCIWSNKAGEYKWVIDLRIYVFFWCSSVTDKDFRPSSVHRAAGDLPGMVMLFSRDVICQKMVISNLQPPTTCARSG